MSKHGLASLGINICESRDAAQDILEPVRCSDVDPVSIRRKVSVMSPSPSIAPTLTDDRDVYLVLDDSGWLGCCWRETDKGSTDRESLICALVDDEFSNPIRIVAFNTAKGWSRDVTVDIAEELRRRYVTFGEVPDS